MGVSDTHHSPLLALKLRAILHLAILAKHIDFIISHVFLPPKLPQKSDDHVDEKNQTLLTFLRETMQEYIAQHVDIADIAQRQFWCSISKMLDEMVKHHEGHLIASQIQNSLQNMVNGGMY